MKKILKLGVFLLFFLLIYHYRNEIVTFAIHLVQENTLPTSIEKNEYYKEDIFDYVTMTNDFDIKNKEQLFQVYYTIVNSGVNEFSFYCNTEYENCISDVVSLADDQKKLSIINGFVHPFNSFSSIETAYDVFGKVTLKVNKSYTQEAIDKINEKVDEIIASEITDDMTSREKIKAIHDYIINHAKYDKDRSDFNITTYQSTTAYGPLLEGYAICGGYTDAMAIFLERFHIPNFAVISENHIWNAVLTNNEWRHLDLTWDDPVTTTGVDVLDYNYFLITTEELEEKETTQHVFNKSIFQEVA